VDPDCRVRFFVAVDARLVHLHDAAEFIKIRYLFASVVFRFGFRLSKVLLRCRHFYASAHSYDVMAIRFRWKDLLALK
jgi:hypothetical protein